MTIDELEKAIEGHKVIRHQGKCFINVRSHEEATHFHSLGAAVFAWPEEAGYEVLIAGMLDPMIEVTEDGDEVDLRASFTLQHFRARDGFDDLPAAMIRAPV